MDHPYKVVWRPSLLAISIKADRHPLGLDFALVECGERHDDRTVRGREPPEYTYLVGGLEFAAMFVAVARFAWLLVLPRSRD